MCTCVTLTLSSELEKHSILQLSGIVVVWSFSSVVSGIAKYDQRTPASTIFEKRLGLVPTIHKIARWYQRWIKLFSKFFLRSIP